MKMFLIWMLLSTAVAAQAPVFPIEINNSGDPLTRGSVVAVDVDSDNPDEGFVALTASHVVVKEIKYDPKQGYTHTYYPATTNFEVYVDSEWLPASVRHVSKEGDVALLTVKTKKKVSKLKIGGSRPDILKPVVISGYVLGLDFEQFPGLAITSGSGADATVYAPEYRVIPGQSGGAVTDGEGRLVGIISSYTGNEPWVINYTPVTEINRFLSVGWDKKIVAGQLVQGTKYGTHRAFPRITRKRIEKMDFKAPSTP
jgi:hypothetical protein